jgi:hypothetical protein
VGRPYDDDGDDAIEDVRAWLASTGSTSAVAGSTEVGGDSGGGGGSVGGGWEEVVIVEVVVDSVVGDTGDADAGIGTDAAGGIDADNDAADEAGGEEG